MQPMLSKAQISQLFFKLYIVNITIVFYQKSIQIFQKNKYTL